MKPKPLFILLTSLALTVLAQQTPPAPPTASKDPTPLYPTPTSFLSLQHPEWPPLPELPDASIQFHSINAAEAIMDDTRWVYMKMPVAATTPEALFRIRAESNFSFTTNHARANARLIPQFKRQVIARNMRLEKPVEQMTDDERYGMARHLIPILRAYDQAAATAVTNELSVEESFYQRNSEMAKTWEEDHPKWLDPFYTSPTSTNQAAPITPKP